MALHQCDLFRGRRPADYLARSAQLFRCSGAVAARRVGNVFYDRGIADVFLRQLMQTGVSHAHDDEPFAVRHPTARLPAGSHAPGAPEDDVARGGVVRRLGVGSPHYTTAFGQRTASTC